MPPKANKSPHYIVAKGVYEGDNFDKFKGFQDLSTYVCGVMFTTDLGNLPSLKLDISPDNGVKFSKGTLSLPNGVTVKRNERILVVETDEDGYNAFTGAEGGEREIKEGIYIMWGTIADISSSVSSSARAFGVIVESELAYLDTTLTQEILGSRPAGFTNGALLRDNPSANKPVDEGLEEGGLNTIEDVLLTKFVNEFAEDEQILIHERTPAFSNTGVEGIIQLPETSQYSVVLSREGSPLVYVSPWRLVRMVLSHTIALSMPSTSSQAEALDIDLSEAQDRVNKIITLMYQIDTQEGEDQNTSIRISRNEYMRFVRHSIIKPIVDSPASAPSLWMLINSILNKVHFYFTPKVLYHSSGASEKNLGSFQMLNPYREYTTTFYKKHIESINNTVPGYKAIVRSVGFKTGADIPKFAGVVSSAFTQDLYRMYTARPEEFVLTESDPGSISEITDFGEVPTYAYHKQIAFPEWFTPSLIPLHQLYNEDIGTEGQYSEQKNSGKGKIDGEGSDSYKTSLNYIGLTLQSFLKSALMIYGRINVTSTVKLIRLWSDCLDPLRVILIDLGDDEQTTGLINRVTVQWEQGKRYDVSLALSNVTDLRDPYFRPLQNDLGITRKDNLTKYLEEKEKREN